MLGWMPVAGRSPKTKFALARNPNVRVGMLGPMNRDLDPRGRYYAGMATEGLFQVEAAP
jgi:hypothetical protein